MKIRVKTLDRKDEELEVPEDASLGALRKIIEEKMGVLESRQRVIFQGRPLLCNDQLLKDYGIADGLTLHMVERPADAAMPPGFNAHGRSGGEERGTRVNVVNGEMVIIRNAVFQDANATARYVREALSSALGAILDCTTTDVEIQENVPRNGDLTLRVHIRGASVRRINSGALSRVEFVTDSLRRTERTLELLAGEAFSAVFSDFYEFAVPEFRNDVERADFGESILELEELLHVSHSDQSQALDPPSTDSSRQTTAVLRNATPEDYMDLLNRLTVVQSHASIHIRRYQDYIRGRIFLESDHAKYIALCYQENIRRVMHRLAHAYHSASDLIVNFNVDNSPLEPSTAQNSEEPVTEVILTLLFTAQRDRNTQVSSNSEGSQQSTNDNATYMSNQMGHSRAFRFTHPMRTGMRSFSVLNPATRTPTVITVPSLGNAGNRMPTFMASSGMSAPIHVQSARVHVSTPVTYGETPMETSGMASTNVSQAERGSANRQTGTITSDGNQTATSVGTNAAGRSGIQNLFRNILQNAIGNMMPMQIGQNAPGMPVTTNIGSGQSNVQSGNQSRYAQPGQPNPSRPSMPAFHSPFGPGIVGQVIVRTNGPANAEATRRAVDAAMQAATAVVGENGVHVQVNGMPRIIPAAGITSGRSRGNIIWARRTYSNRGSREGGAVEQPTDMFIGPNYPSDSSTYTNDPHLNCQSNLYNPRACIHNSSAYEAVLSDLYQATLRYKASLDPDSAEAEDVDALIGRWDRVRGFEEADSHVALNQRGEALFEHPEHFRNVLKTMLRRAVANLADADSHIARRLNASQGEYDVSNYGMIPVISAPLHGFDIAGPPIGSFELDTVDIEGFDASQTAHNRDDSMGDDGQGNRTDTTQESVSSETQASRSGDEEGGEADLDIVDMVRTLSDLMQSGRSTTLAQAMREMGQPVTRLSTGFVNLVMVLAYELLQVSELVQILSGNFSSLSRNRQQIRRFIIENVFNDNCRPTDEDIKSAAERVALSESELDRFLAFDDVHRYANVDGIGRIDLVASVLRLEKRVVEEFLRHLMRCDDDLSPEEYSKTIVDMFSGYVYRAVVLTNLSMNGQPYDYENLLLRFMDQPSGEDERHLLSVMSHMSMTHIRLLLRRDNPFGVSDMMEDIVLVNEGDDTDATTTLSSSSVVEDATQPSIMTEECEKEDRRLEDVNMQDSSSREGSWKSVLPKDWIPVIEDDMNRSAMPGMNSFSDAYLSGSCSAKRKGMKVAMEGSFNAVVSSAVRRSVEEAVSYSGYTMPDAPVETEVTEVLQNEFDDLIRKRVADDTEFDSTKYPELNKFLKKEDS